ncbi:MAG: aromatic ring-hydroxylating dioxygenase subunit alpha, partial [Actinomycetota bacterium]
MGAAPIDVTAPATWAGTWSPLTEATGLHPALYTDPAVHQVELERVFERSWVCVGLAAEANRPGTVLVRQVGRRSILVTVAADGSIHGHLNSCR